MEFEEDDIINEFNKMTLGKLCPLCISRKHPIQKGIRTNKLVNKLINDKTNLGKYNFIKNTPINRSIKQLYQIKEDYIDQMNKKNLQLLIEQCRIRRLPIVENKSTTIAEITEEINRNTMLDIEMKPVLECVPNKKFCIDHLCPICQNRSKSSKVSTCYDCYYKKNEIIIK